MDKAVAVSRLTAAPPDYSNLNFSHPPPPVDTNVLVEFALDAGERQPQFGAGLEQNHGGMEFRASLVAIFIIAGDRPRLGEAIFQRTGHQRQLPCDDLFGGAGCSCLFHSAIIGATASGGDEEIMGKSHLSIRGKGGNKCA